MDSFFNFLTPQPGVDPFALGNLFATNPEAAAPILGGIGAPPGPGQSFMDWVGKAVSGGLTGDGGASPVPSGTFGDYAASVRPNAGPQVQGALDSYARNAPGLGGFAGAESGGPPMGAEGGGGLPDLMKKMTGGIGDAASGLGNMLSGYWNRAGMETGQVPSGDANMGSVADWNRGYGMVPPAIPGAAPAPAVGNPLDITGGGTSTAPAAPGAPAAPAKPTFAQALGGAGKGLKDAMSGLKAPGNPEPQIPKAGTPQIPHPSAMPQAGLAQLIQAMVGAGGAGANPQTMLRLSQALGGMRG